MKKRFLFLVMAFVVCQGLQAQNTDALKYFNLVMPDNSLVSYELGSVIEIHFQDSIMMVNDLSFYMGEGVKYFFSEEDLTEVKLLPSRAPLCFNCTAKIATCLLPSTSYHEFSACNLTH